jgi:hypothetical protein
MKIALAAFATINISNVTAEPPSMASIDFLLSGYDVLFGNPKPTGDGVHIDPGFRQAVFAADYTEHILSDDNRYSLPKGTQAKSCSGSCSLSFDSSEITGAKSYQNSLEVAVSTSVSYKSVKFKAKFSASTDYKHVEQGSSKERHLFTHSEASCCAYTAGIETYTPPPLDLQFITAVKTLPLEYDQSAYAEFIHTFGTHFVTEVTMGGLFGQQSEITEKSWSKMVQDGLDIKTAAKFSGYGATAKATFERETEEKMASEFASQCENQQLYTIGASPPEDHKVETWAQKTLTDPQPIKMKIESIDNLFDERYGNADDQIRENVRTALKDYCQKLMDEGVVQSCEAPGDDPLPPGPIAKFSSCRFCANQCGDNYKDGGAIMVDKSDPAWAQISGPRCDGTMDHQETDGGAHLCCGEDASDPFDSESMAEDSTTKQLNEAEESGCRLCKSCGGDFSHGGTKLMKHKNWPEGILAYDDSCQGAAPAHRTN